MLDGGWDGKRFVFLPFLPFLSLSLFLFGGKMEHTFIYKKMEKKDEVIDLGQGFLSYNPVCLYCTQATPFQVFMQKKKEGGCGVFDNNA